MNSFCAIQTIVFFEIFFHQKKLIFSSPIFFFFEELSESFDTGRELCI